MSTFKELVNKSRQMCGVSGADLTTVVGVTGEARRFARWVVEAWNEIQLLQSEWKFMHLDFTVSTVAGQRAYTSSDASLASFRRWDLDSLRIYADTVNFSDEMILPFLPYKSFRDVYEYATMRTQRNRPVAFTVGEQNELRLGALPDAVYVVAGKYWRGSQTLAADDDVPICPADYHDAIIYKVKMKYGLFESAPEVYEDGKEQYDPIVHALVNNQGPDLSFGAPLA